MNSTFTSRSLGRCLTEYKRVNFDVLVARAKQYIVYSQFDTKRVVGRYVEEPRCGYGEVLYAVLEDGSQTELMSIIDSSD